MLQQQRLHRIQNLLNQMQQLSTEQVMNELEISRETARRDIIELESLGLVKRVHGGITLTDSQIEAPLKIRNTQRAKEKQAIARKAIQQLHSGQIIFIDAGSTTSFLAEQLKTISGLTIISNSLQVMLNLMQTNNIQNHELILLGGRIQNRPQTHGDLVIQEIQRYHADIAFLSPVGVCSKFGASSFCSSEASIAKAMQERSSKTIILADHSKIGIQSRIQYATPDQIDLLITNRHSQNKLLYGFTEVLLA